MSTVHHIKIKSFEIRVCNNSRANKEDLELDEKYYLRKAIELSFINLFIKDNYFLHSVLPILFSNIVFSGLKLL